MKKYILLLLAFSAILVGCYEEIEDLPLSELEQGGNFLEIVDHEYSRASGFARVYFEDHYNFEKNASIRGILVYKNGSRKFMISSPEQNYFEESSLPFNGRVCYRIGYRTNSGVVIKITPSYCIDL